MFRTLFARRRREDQRVDAFLDAIRLSERYTLDPRWELQMATHDTTPLAPVQHDTAPLPLSLLQLLVPAGAQS